MNYLPVVSLGVYGGTTVEERNAQYASWGLLSDAPAPTTVVWSDGLYFVQALGGGVCYIKKL